MDSAQTDIQSPTFEATDSNTSKHSSALRKQHLDLLHDAKEEYQKSHPNSLRLHQDALEVLPGGNTRSVLHTDPFPIYMDRGEGNRLVDVDGHEYLDLIGEMTAGLCGHSNPLIQETILSTIHKTGLNLGATTAIESQFAQEICRRFPSIERVRFCNSGTEANLYALSVARQATGLSKVIVFSGGYHGGVLMFVHGVASNTVDQDDWIVGNYNDVEGVRKLISENKGKAAAVLVEGMQGAGGCIPGNPAFLHAIQTTANEAGILFILDEVMTSRLGPGGLQSRILDPIHQTALRPDMTTLGKYIAGGMTIGAFGGRKDLLSVYDPRLGLESRNGEESLQPMSHSGTFNNNTLAMSVGCATLSTVYTAQVCIDLNAMGERFRQNLLEICRGTRMTVTGVGAVCNIHFLSQIPRSDIECVEELEREQTEDTKVLGDIFWFHAIRQGFWMARRGMLALIMGTTEPELGRFLAFVKRFVWEFLHLIV
ncbi:pyridoxal phosphate-dependent transferase [Penicillium canariense]|uniref:Pyridoxal phosphate-dependent transferase n=1 Tax=Penicillium canariense TaxID=189055 RepID=A0A9W9LNT5_9EURO|nr:pyridoxal phosphate-dependent transferase [Penicillium canariense]KAJ5168234.1 pyridoxal phosphate-dependent transferase [Penicillium canariense]